MNYLTIDDIAAQINETANELDEATLRYNTVAYVKKVYERVHEDALFIPMICTVPVPQSGAVSFPADLHQFIDASIGGIGLRQIDAYGKFNGQNPRFRLPGDHLQFTREDAGQSVTITYWGIPTTESGEILVDSRIEYLCVLWGQKMYERKKLAKAATHQIARATIAQYDRDFNEELSNVRAQLNKMTMPQWRDMLSQLRSEIFTAYDY